MQDRIGTSDLEVTTEIRVRQGGNADDLKIWHSDQRTNQGAIGAADQDLRYAQLGQLLDQQLRLALIGLITTSQTDVRNTKGFIGHTALHFTASHVIRAQAVKKEQIKKPLEAISPHPSNSGAQAP